MQGDRAVLVTGGAGFIGSHLCETLLHHGRHVICLDNFQTGQRENIAHLIGRRGFRLIDHDVIAPLPPSLEPGEIYNLACAASPPQYQRDPVHTLKTNVMGALNLLELARASGARILQASTSEVYGDPLLHPQAEDYWGNVNPVGPRSCYDEGKRAAETLFFDYLRQHQVTVKVARIFNTYGPRMHFEDGRIVSTFIHQALTGEPLTVNGDGRQTRSFCFVDDMVRALQALMESPEDVTGPINLGNPDEQSVLAIARLVLRLTASRSPLEFRPLPIDDPKRRRPDIDRARTLLGWRPQVSLEAGLIRTIENFRIRLATTSELAAAS